MVASISIVAVGFFRSWIHVPLPLAIAESCSSKRFPAAYGLYMITTGIFNILLPILLGKYEKINYLVVLHFMFNKLLKVYKIDFIICCRY